MLTTIMKLPAWEVSLFKCSPVRSHSEEWDLIDMRCTRICLDGRIPNLKRLHFHRNASNIRKHFPAKLWVKRLALSSALCRYGLRSLQYTRYHFLAWGLRKLEKCSSEAGPTPHPLVTFLTHDIYVSSVCSVCNCCNVRGTCTSTTSGLHVGRSACSTRSVVV